MSSSSLTQIITSCLLILLPFSLTLLILLTSLHVCYISVYQIICRGCFFRRKFPESKEETCSQCQSEQNERSRTYLV